MTLAFDLYQQGILLVPTGGRGAYQVAYANWREKFPSQEPYLEVWAQFANSQPEVLCGIGDVVAIDVDEKNKAGIAAIFDEELRLSLPDLYPLLYVEKTASGGMHYFFKRAGTKSEDIAFAPVPQTLEEEFGGAPIKYRPIIEIKGENKLCRCWPCEGIEKLQGDILTLPVVSDADFQHMRYLASLLNDRPDEVKEIAKQKSSVTVNSDNPGTDYSNNVDPTEIVSLLEKHGWKMLKGNAYRGRILLNRPGAKTRGVDADILNRVFCAWSGSVENFTVGKGYSFFSLYGMLEHNGDFTAAAKALKERGYGKSVTIQHGEAPVRSEISQNGVEVSGEAEQQEMTLWDKIKAEIDRSWSDEDTAWNLTFRHQEGASSEVFGVASAGMTVLIGGRHKSRKSAYISAIIASNLANAERCGHRLEGDGMIIWIDSEQGRKWVREARQRIMIMAGVDRAGFEKRVLYVPLAAFGTHQDKFAAILEVIGRYEKILAVVIDGMKDAVSDVNDLKECTSVVSALRGLANKKMFTLFAVMHINKNDRAMQGHMGALLEKVSDIRYDAVYDEDTGYTNISCPFSRGERVPPFSFKGLRGNIPQIIGYPQPEYEYGEYFPPKNIEGQVPDAEFAPQVPFRLPETSYEDRLSLAQVSLTDEELEQLYSRG